MAEAENTRKSGRGIRILLFASLALNLLIIGTVAGALLSGGPRGPDPRRSAEGAMFPLIRALPSESRDGLRDRYRETSRSYGDRKTERAAQRTEILALLRADPFDATAFATYLDTQFARARERGVAGRSALVEQIEALSASERQAYADRLEDYLSRDPKKRFKHRK